MPEASDYNELARRYGLEAIPASVVRLTQLVSRQDAGLDEIAAFIAEDPRLSSRILRIANPSAKCEAEYTIETVQQALMRHGIGCAFLVGMGAPLAEAIAKTFSTMLSCQVQRLDPKSVRPLAGKHLLGTVRFHGKATGQVYLRLSFAAAKEVAARMLDVGQSELADAAVHDALAELLNIITGNFKSNMCDAGLPCRLQVPQVSACENFGTEVQPGCGLERMVFQASSILLYVDVSVNPWN